MTNTNNIRILERVNVAQDKGLVIAEICGEYYLLSFSNERVDILMKLDGQRLKKTTGTTPPDMQNFKDVLRTAFKNGRWDMTGNDRKHKG